MKKALVAILVIAFAAILTSEVVKDSSSSSADNTNERPTPFSIITEELGKVVSADSSSPDITLGYHSDTAMTTAALFKPQMQTGAFEVVEVDKTSAALPGYMFYPRELPGYPQYGMTMMVWTVEQESQVYEWNVCPGTDVHEAANWLRVLPQYVKIIWEGDQPAYVINLPEPGWVYVQAGRLQYMDGAELTTPDAPKVDKAYKIWTQNATWRCKSKFASPPPLPAKNIVFTDGSSPGNDGGGGEQPNQPQPTTPDLDLDIATVKSWCSNCEGTFKEVQEGDNTIVTYQASDPAKECVAGFDVPRGHQIQGTFWNVETTDNGNYNATVTKDHLVFPNVCVATFRRVG